MFCNSKMMMAIVFVISMNVASGAGCPACKRNGKYNFQVHIKTLSSISKSTKNSKDHVKRADALIRAIKKCLRDKGWLQNKRWRKNDRNEGWYRPPPPNKVVTKPSNSSTRQPAPPATCPPLGVSVSNLVKHFKTKPNPGFGPKAQRKQSVSSPDISKPKVDERKQVAVKTPEIKRCNSEPLMNRKRRMSFPNLSGLKKLFARKRGWSGWSIPKFNIFGGRNKPDKMKDKKNDNNNKSQPVNQTQITPTPKDRKSVV